MKVYKWTGSGRYLDGAVICIADCLKSAKQIIEKELNRAGLSRSWQESEEIEEFDTNGCKVVYFDDGDY